MTAYNAIVVGTDGSESSLRAVARAATIAGSSTKLIIACAFRPADDKNGAYDDILKGEAYKVHGSTPTDDILRLGKEHATKFGATEIITRSVTGAPVEALLGLASEVRADLLVVGNRGLNSVSGRILGSVPADVARKAEIDVLIVHTV